MFLLALAFSCASPDIHDHDVVDHGASDPADPPDQGDDGSGVVEVAAGAELTYGVPDDAILVYDISGRYPFFVWTEPLIEMGSLDPDLVFFLDVEEGYVESTESGAGYGGDEHSEEVVEEGEEVDGEGTTLMFAYVGDVPIESVSVDYAGVLPPPAGSATPPPGWSSYEYGSTSQRRSVVWNYLSSSVTADFEHKHSSSASYHDLTSNKTVSAGGCKYAYDCVYTSSGTLRTRLYTSVESDSLEVQFKTSCSASCY